MLRLVRVVLVVWDVEVRVAMGAHWKLEPVELMEMNDIQWVFVQKQAESSVLKQLFVSAVSWVVSRSVPLLQSTQPLDDVPLVSHIDPLFKASEQSFPV